jgi:hypothetical protein
MAKIKRELNLNAPPAANLLFSKPVAAPVLREDEDVEKVEKKVPVAKEKTVKKVIKSEVKDLQTTIYIATDDYAVIKGLVALKRGEGDPFYNLRNAFADIAKLLVEQYPKLTPYHGKLK